MGGPYSARLLSSPTRGDIPTGARLSRDGRETNSRPKPTGGRMNMDANQTMERQRDDHSTGGFGEDLTFHHLPVMCTEVVDVIHMVPAGLIVDATVGGGGHAAAILAARPDLHLLGIDRDEAALNATAAHLAPFGDRVALHRSTFGDFSEALTVVDGLQISGFLFDLGVSSAQLDQVHRGFSYRNAAPLDMRMDQRQQLSAYDVVNDYDEADLAQILWRYADERYARRIARFVVAARPVIDTSALAELVRQAIPAPARRRGGHPAKRTFQAIRIEVNGELDQLAGALDSAIDRLVPGGRCAVLSYHSGEDRIVKNRFDLAATGGCTCPPRLPCGCGAEPLAVLPRRSGWTPSGDETKNNPRAASARLRVVERIERRVGQG
ncbi:MAG: 16S rRNA (cytosine(1402)-N(4))-methyltransferase RsmH [Acidimicrobiales bacterium]|nr:16S rRNA (cytosine(1402)-N(4))-methyltransferase RsmH [Acidimicrobiales bacterium]